MRFINVGNAMRFMGCLPCPAFNAPVDAPANRCLDPVRDYECDLLHTWQLGWLVLSSPTSEHWSARPTRPAFLEGRLDCVAMPSRREEHVRPGQPTAIVTIGVLVPDVSRHHITFAFCQSYEVKYDESLFAGLRGRHRRRHARHVHPLEGSTTCRCGIS